MIIIKPRHEETCLTVLSERYHEIITRKKYMYCINNVSITQSQVRPCVQKEALTSNVFALQNPLYPVMGPILRVDTISQQIIDRAA